MKNLNIEQADWISEEKLTLSFEDEGITIGNCLPPIFESYCKVFHPFEITTDEPDTLENDPDLKEDLAEIITFNYRQGTHKTTNPWEASGGDLNLKLRMTDPNLKRWEYVTWQEIAEKYELIFHNEINPDSYITRFDEIGYPWNLWFPKGGYLPRPVFKKLNSVLSSASQTHEVCIYQMPPNNIYKMELVSGSLEDVSNYFEEDFIGCMYASDKSWLVFTDTDLHFTLMAGPESLITAIVNSEIEAVRCSADTRVDYLSDKVNNKKTYT
ncbi:hypothetical protein [uncultured Pontibacter sp.]|uniref:hypothetical protein n=1 Tax=uncultured Pontibacter sp. TaxID=453356 RepID=UPI00262DD6E1|nr:hypothetical protein [uncultured Pontibacter sp.]